MRYIIWGVILGIIFILITFGLEFKVKKKPKIRMNIPKISIEMKDSVVIINDYHIHHWLIFTILLLFIELEIGIEKKIKDMIKGFSVTMILHGLMYADRFDFKLENNMSNIYMTSQFYADDIRNYNSSNEEVNEFFNQEYLSKMESLEAELGALDKLLEEKATKDNKRSDFRKNVTMKAGRGLRKMLGFSEGRRDTLEKRIKEKEEEWKAIAKKYHTNNDKSNPFSMNYEEDHDKKLKKAIEDFENERFKKRSIIHTIDSTKKMGREARKSYKYDTQHLDDYVTEHGSEDDIMTVSLGGRRRRRTRKRRRKKRTKKRGKKRRRKRTRRK